MYQNKKLKFKKKKREDRLLLASMNHLPRVIEHAPEGSTRHLDGYVVVKRAGIKKKWRDVPPRKDKFNDFLGYIKPGKNGRPRKFRVFVGNPIEDKWSNKIACKSYKPEKEESEGE
jgi:hypothetical protein